MNRVVSRLLGFFGMIFVVLGLMRSTDIATRSGMVDFRNRVVAARQAELGLNPYLFKWNPSYPETLLDPSDERTTKYTRLTSPPTTLWFHSLFAGLPYSVQKEANFVLSWLALFGIAVWLGWRLRAPIGVMMFITGAFSLSALWQFHVERGQQYVYFTLFLSFAVFPPREKLTAVFQALAVFFRPTSGLAVFASFRERHPLRTIAIGAGVGALLLVPVLLKYPLSYWLDYHASAHDWYRHHWGPPEQITPAGDFAYPAAPEGDPTMNGVANFGAVGSLFQHFAAKAGWIPSYTLGFAITGAITVFSGWKLWRARAEPVAAFAGRFFSAIYLADYFLPAPRSGYNAVFFFPALIVAGAEIWRGGLWSRENSWAFVALVGLGFSLEALFLPYSSPMFVELLYLVGAGMVLGKRTLSSEG